MARHTRLSGTKPATSSGNGNCSSTSVRRQPNFSPLTWYLKVMSSEVASNTSLGYISPTICPLGRAHKPVMATKRERSGSGISPQASAIAYKALVSRLSSLSSATTSRSEEHTSELQSLMRSSYAVFCLKKKTYNTLLLYTHIYTDNNT